MRAIELRVIPCGLGQEQARRVRGEGLPRAVRSGETGLGFERRRGRRGAADDGRLSRRQRGEASRVEIG